MTYKTFLIRGLTYRERLESLKEIIETGLSFNDAKRKAIEFNDNRTHEQEWVEGVKMEFTSDGDNP